MSRIQTCCAVLPWLLAACQPAAAPGWSGYVEGDYVYVSSALGGTLSQLQLQLQLQVQAGAQVSLNQPLFALEAENEQAARLEAQARLARSTAQLANSQKGRRRDEIVVVQAQLQQASAQARLAAAELARQEPLLQQGFVSAARLEDVRAAAAETDVARQVLRQSAWREAQKNRTAPASGLMADTFFRVGEWVAPGQPVLSLLPPGQVKVRFFVPEKVLGTLQLGAAVRIVCDGCAAPVVAHISLIANRAEYTPPVIYSNAQRAKLVFMVEARPDPVDAARLRPGQPVDVLPGAGGTP